MSVVTEKPYNRFKREHYKYDDILEDFIKVDKLNQSDLTIRLKLENRGKHKRVAHNHELRLAAWREK